MNFGDDLLLIFLFKPRINKDSPLNQLDMMPAFMCVHLITRFKETLVSDVFQ